MPKFGSKLINVAKLYRNFKALERELFPAIISGVLVQTRLISKLMKYFKATRLSFANTFMFAHDLRRSSANRRPAYLKSAFRL